MTAGPLLPPSSNLRPAPARPARHSHAGRGEAGARQLRNRRRLKREATIGELFGRHGDGGTSPRTSKNPPPDLSRSSTDKVKAEVLFTEHADSPPECRCSSKATGKGKIGNPSSAAAKVHFPHTDLAHRIIPRRGPRGNITQRGVTEASATFRARGQTDHYRTSSKTSTVIRKSPPITLAAQSTILQATLAASLVLVLHFKFKFVSRVRGLMAMAGGRESMLAKL